MSASKLTTLQASCLERCREHVTAHGKPPSLNQLAKSMGLLHRQSVAQLVAALEAKGFIRVERDKRGMALAMTFHEPIDADETLAKVRALIEEWGIGDCAECAGYDLVKKIAVTLGMDVEPWWRTNG